MPRLAVLRNVQHHQPLLGDGRLHASGLAYQCRVYGGQQWQDALQSTLAAHLLLARCQEDEVVVLAVLGEPSECCQQRHHRCSGIVAAEAVEPTVGFGGRERVEGPALGRLHGVDVAVEQHRRARRVEIGAYCPHVVAAAPSDELPVLHLLLYYVSHLSLVAAYAGSGNHALQQVLGIVV